MTTITIIIALVIYRKYFELNLSQDFNLVFITLIGAIIGYIYNAISTTFSGMVLTAKQELPEYMGLATVPVKIAVALNGMGAVFLAMANSLGVLFSFITSVILFRGIPIEKPTSRLKKEYISFSIPLAVVEILRTISIHADKVILHFFCGPASVGYLYAAQRIVNLIQYFIISIRKIFFPVITENIEKRDNKKVCELLNKTIFTLLFILLPVVMFLSIYSKQIIILIAGSEFKESYIILVMLSIALVFQGIGLMFSSVIVGSGDNYLYRQIGVVIYSFTIILNLFLVPDSLFGFTLFGLGAVGVSLSLLLASFFNFIWYYIAVKKKISFQFERNSFVVISSATISFSLLYLADNYINNVIITLFSLILSNLLFISIIFLLKGISKATLREYFNLFNMFRMKDYILNELKDNGK